MNKNINNDDRMNEVCVEYRLSRLLDKARDLSIDEIKKKNIGRPNLLVCHDCFPNEHCKEKHKIELSKNELTILEDALFNYLNVQ